VLCFGVIGSGSLNISYQNETVKLTTDSIAVFNPDQAHVINNIDAKDYFVMYLNQKWCKNIQEEIFFNSSQNLFIDKKIVKKENIFTLFKDIYSKQNNGHYIDELINIVQDIYRDHSVTDLADKTCKITNIIKSYIDSNLDNQISIKLIANKLGYNKSYLIRVFKSETGLTPQEYIISRKISRSKEYLELNKHKNLIDVAYANGFYDQSHFNRNFKKIYAITPTIYKKSILYNT